MDTITRILRGTPSPAETTAIDVFFPGACMFSPGGARQIGPDGARAIAAKMAAGVPINSRRHKDGRIGFAAAGAWFIVDVDGDMLQRVVMYGSEEAYQAAWVATEDAEEAR